MGHLTIESLARLVNEAPTPEEEKHLESCVECRNELEALRGQTEAIGTLPDLRPPPGDWEALEARLASEGLIRSSGLGRRGPKWWASGWMQAAAAVVLFLGGTTLGSAFTASDRIPELAQQGPPQGLELIPVGAQAQSVSNIADATAAVNIAEQQYMLALLQYRQILDVQGGPNMVGEPTSRLAAIEAILASARAAINQAPADPYVNGVLVSALAEKEAFLRNATLVSGGIIF
jgi:hypothetical protein